MLVFDASCGKDWETPSDAPLNDVRLLLLLQLWWLLLLLPWPGAGEQMSESRR